jgi:hypothetical protein
MNRDLQKLLQEKWFLVAADLIAVIGVLCIGFNPKDGFEAFLAAQPAPSRSCPAPALLDAAPTTERVFSPAGLDDAGPAAP